MLLNPSSPDTAPEMTPIRDAAPRVGIEFQPAEARTEAEIDAALHRLSSLRVDAVLVGADPFYMDRRKEIAQQAARLGLPAIYPFREFVTAGGLLSYGTSISETIGRAGQYAARILKGAQPSELPVQQPTTFHLVVNGPAAKALGISVPATLLARADEVIE